MEISYEIDVMGERKKKGLINIAFLSNLWQLIPAKMFTHHLTDPCMLIIYRYY